MAELTTAVRIASPERGATRWIEAFNVGDLDGMLACLARYVAFYPVRLSGLEACYRGHDGVRCWFAQLRRHRYAQTISLWDLRGLGDVRVFATGWLSLAEDPGIAPFCAPRSRSSNVRVPAR
ncbi:MAG TPA: hypothetical protein VKR21_18915 [Solirubrobacteraceae bacterium]|nr:hypothetical protein [Solirubrobacteraceae bacterium]